MQELGVTRGLQETMGAQGHSPVGCLGREEGALSGWPSSSEPVPGRHGASWVGVTSRTCRQEKCCWIKGDPP